MFRGVRFSQRSFSTGARQPSLFRADPRGVGFFSASENHKRSKVCNEKTFRPLNFGFGAEDAVAPIVVLSVGLIALADDREEERILGKKAVPTKIEMLEDAIAWMQEYHAHKRPELFVEGIMRLVEAAKDAKEVDKSHLYLRLVGFMSEVFKQNPGRLKEWFYDLSSKSTDKDFVPYIWYALSVTGMEEAQETLLEMLDRKYPAMSDTNKMNSLRNFHLTVTRNTFVFPGNAVAVMIGKFHACGNTAYIERVVRVYEIGFHLILQTNPHMHLGEVLKNASEDQLDLVERATKDFVELCRDPIGFDMVQRLWMVQENPLLKDTMGTGLLVQGAGKGV